MQTAWAKARDAAAQLEDPIDRARLLGELSIMAAEMQAELREARVVAIRQAIATSGGRAVARELGISRGRLYALLAPRETGG